MRLSQTAMSCVLAVVSCSVLAFGPEGHEAVGEVADEILKQNPEIKQAVDKLLGENGLTLKHAAILPDTIKGWDRWDKEKGSIKGPQPLAGVSDEVFHDLAAFWKANMGKVDGQLRHHVFHYTDISVASDLQYAVKKKGASKTDVVQMITCCIDVLKGKRSEKNKYKITKRVAVVLLAHYLGDIHQPLHVGAEFFDKNGMPADPDATKAFGDQGGNKVTLILGDRRYSLHSFWDGDAVKAAFGTHVAPQAIANMASQAPAGWVELKGSGAKWSEEWANEILPVAQEAHRRLKYSNVVVPKSGKDIKEADATLVDPTQDYKQWAAEKVQQGIHKAGWRLAAVLKSCLATH